MTSGEVLLGPATGGRRGDPDPYGNYAWLRENCPVSPVPGDADSPTWLVTTFDLVRSCLGDARLSSDPRHLGGAVADGFERNLQGMDPPEHTRLRRVVSRAFSPRSVEAARPGIAAVCNEAIDALSGRTEADLVAEYALVVPVAVIHRLLGVPPELAIAPAQCLEKFWSASVKQPADEAAIEELRGYTASIVDACRSVPGQGVVSELLEALDAGALRDELEVQAMIFLLLGAGHATSVPFLGAAILRLLQNPCLVEEALRDATRWPSYVEEALRLDSPSQASAARYATEDLEIGGVQVARGDTVVLSLAAANRDPLLFDDAERFAPRPVAPAHLAFGHGLHVCVGAHLARAEGEIALRTLFERLSGPRLSLDEVTWALGPMLRCPASLPVTFDGVADATPLRGDRHG